MYWHHFIYWVSCIFKLNKNKVIHFKGPMPAGLTQFLIKDALKVRHNSWQLKALYKWWKVLFIPPWKLFLFLSYLNFCPDFFGHVGKWLDKKAKVNLKTHNAINWETNKCNTQHCQCIILRNISARKGNQAIKFVYLIYMRIIFLQNSYTKYGGETSRRAFYEKLELSTSLS